MAATPKKTTPNRVAILSIDGGGIRGILPAIFLAEVERRTGKPIASLFDLIAGSSTGGMLALIANIPNEIGQPLYRADQFADLYTQRAKVIFSRTRWEAILAMDNWSQRRYPNTGIAETLEDLFKELRLNQAVTDVLVTSYDIERREPVFFRSYFARQFEAENFLMRDVIRSTTAAPTFFEPAKIPHPEAADEYYALVDGSMTAINPAMCAYIEARDMFPHADEIVLVSIGTGNLTQPLPYEDVRKWGLLNWVRPLSDIMFDGSSRTVDYQLRRLLPDDPDGTRHYYRFQKRIEGFDHRMDDASDFSLGMIHQWAREMLQENDAQIDALCHILTAYKAPQVHTEETRRRFLRLSNWAFWRRGRNRTEDKPKAK
ncbi:MAG: patatin-like phospholipase family protein [Phototrophicaceae bacterium]